MMSERGVHFRKFSYLARLSLRIAFCTHSYHIIYHLRSSNVNTSLVGYFVLIVRVLELTVT